MPQNSGIYGVARIRCHETGLIGRDMMARLIDGSAEEAVRMLVDAGYGSMPDATVDDMDQLIESELKITYELVREVSFDPLVTDLFLMKADVHNLKVLLKLRLQESKEEPVLMQGGVYPPEVLAHMVQEGDYRELPKPFQQHLDQLEKAFVTQVDPVAVSVALDRAYVEYAYACKLPRKYAFVKEYFRMQADFNNVLALLRVREMQGGVEQLQAMLLPQGDIPHQKLLEALDTPLEALGKEIAQGPAREGILQGLEAMQHGAGISALEKARDNALMQLISRRRHAFDTIAPVVGYLLAREQEARCIRLIITAKRNGLPVEIITERLRDLYD